MVWLNPPRWRVVVQSVARTVRRAVTREELWAGNRESWAGLCFWREDSIVRFAWTTYAPTRDRYAAAMGEAQGRPVWRRLRTRRDVARFVDGLSRGPG